MSDHGQNAEWLSLIDISGPFLAEPVLKEAFPQGLEALDASKRKLVRQAYDEWREALDLDDPEFPKIHRAWIDLVLKRTLELDEDGKGEVLKTGRTLPENIKLDLPEPSNIHRPDYVVVDGQGNPPLMLVSVYDPQVTLGEALARDGWNASPSERMVDLCRATNVRLGLVTNGEQWMLVDAPIGAVTTFATWYAGLWNQEPITLQAFVNLLGIRRFFVDHSEQLPALLDNSLKFQDEVTDALGEQVRRAVEVLIQALDRADVDRNRELLKDIEPSELYESGLTVMMRIVFLLCAEERGLLLMGDECYETNYAVSTLRLRLRSESEEILERRWDAWSRLLSIFRGIYGGIEHDAMRLPALGGSLFDPDRFPFLEGRSKGSHWKADPATPLPIDNRTVLLLLDAVQLFQGRTLSYRALDVEQIGYVYEGLLERTAARTAEVTLDLDATKNANNRWVSLPEINDAALKGHDAVEALLKERTGSSAGRIRNDLERPVDDSQAEKLLIACHGDLSLRDAVKRYFHLLRTDPWGYPLVYPEGTFIVTTGTGRRETGTHYTPKSFTDVIVKETLEPVVYVGPIEGKPRNEWKLKSPAELLDLKICDPAMGSGAFLVQVCRWLSDRLVEAWAHSEAAGEAVTADGGVVEKLNGYEPLRIDTEERLLMARRLIAERCLYGVDVNPLAVELAKLSIWLITLAKGRPFGFLDHNLRRGDSLLGIHTLEQLHYLDIRPGKGSSKKLFASQIDQIVQDAIALRSELRSRPIRDIRDVEVMTDLDKQAGRVLAPPELIADALVGETLVAKGKNIDATALSIEAGVALQGNECQVDALKQRAIDALSTDLPAGKPSRRPFHWPLEFPEVFISGRPGFDAFVGNPPFLGGKRISSTYGASYERWLKTALTQKKGAADICAYFFLRANALTRQGGGVGFLATNTISQTDTREIGLTTLTAQGEVYFAVPSMEWPGTAAVFVSLVMIHKGRWLGQKRLNGKVVDQISEYLTDSEALPQARRLLRNKERFFGTKGTYVHGKGFVLSDEQAHFFIAKDARNKAIVKPYLVARDFTTSPRQEPSRWVIDFGDMDEKSARQYPLLFDHLEATVKPHREKLKGQIHEHCFWKFWDKRAELYSKIGELTQVIVCPEVSKYSVFALVPNKYVFSSMVNVIASDSPAILAILQSSFHGIWAWSQGSTMKNDLRYTTSDCLDTFPFPSNTDHIAGIGKAFSDARHDVMEDRGIGLTAVYNLIHDQRCSDEDIQSLRSCIANVDSIVAKSYEFQESEVVHDFHVGERGVRYGFDKSLNDKILRRLSLLNDRDYKAETGPRTLSRIRGRDLDRMATDENDLFSQRERSGR